MWCPLLIQRCPSTNPNQNLPLFFSLHSDQNQSERNKASVNYRLKILNKEIKKEYKQAIVVPNPGCPFNFNNCYPPIVRFWGLNFELFDGTYQKLRKQGMATVKGKEGSLILTSGASGRIRALLSLRALRNLLVLLNALVLLLLSPFRKGSVVRVALKSTSTSTARTRRALAIRRVLEDDDATILRHYFLFRTKRGHTIFTQSWIPLSRNFRGVVLLMHGLNEHSGRYSNFAKQLNANGFKVYGMDWVGHGGSDGMHAYVHSLDDAVSDMKVFLEKILTENPGLPCFCFGHSTGAAITLKALLDPEVEARIAGAVLTSPAVGVAPSHPILLVLAPIVSFLLPTYQFSSAYKKGLPVSRDPEALIAKYSDPLVCTGPLRVRTGHEILRITSYLQQNLRKLRVPFFVLHGTADSVTDPDASQKLYEEASSSDKTIKLYDGYLHDLLFEPERDAITQDILQWLNSRV